MQKIDPSLIGEELKEQTLFSLIVSQIYLYMTQVRLNISGMDNPFFNLKAG
jgi:hypothetical protein